MIDTFCKYLEKEGLSPHTIRAYRRAVNRFATWSQQTYGEPFDPAITIPRDVRDWDSFLRTVERVSIRTANQYITSVHCFFKWAVDNGHASKNPVQVRLQRPPERHPKALSKLDQSKLLRAVHKAGVQRDIALIELMLGTGLRREEAITLTRSDVELNPRSGFVTVTYGKFGKPRRVPIPASARTALQNHLSNSDTRGGQIWIGQRGPLKDGSAINRLIKNYCLAAGIDPVTPHQLRHTYATRYLEANQDDLRGLADNLGHTDLETLMIYTVPTDEQRAARVENL